jgi:hypothetical protein
MALFAVVSAIAPGWILAGRFGIVTGVALAAAAATQLALGNTRLSRREVTLSGIAVVLFVAGLLTERVLLLPARIDFSAYYIAGHVVAENPPGRLYNQVTFPDGRIVPLNSASEWKDVARRHGVESILPFVYTPFFAVLMRPLAYLSYSAAYGVWTAITVMLTVVSVWLGVRLSGWRLSVELAVILVVGVFSYHGFFEELLLGQADSLLLLLLTLGVWLLRREQDWGSALCFAVATMIKITPVIAVPLLVMHRRWKWLAAYGCWMLGLVGFSVWQAGWAAHAQFLHEVVPSVSCGIATIANLSVVGFVQELFLGSTPKNLLQATLPPLACAVSKTVALVVLCAVMVRFYVYRRTESLELHVVLVILLSLVISPLTWLHHYVIALLPFFYLWGREWEVRKDYLLLATVLAVGTNFTVFPLPMLFKGQVGQLILAGVIPCLTLALVWFRIGRDGGPQISLDSAG